MNRVVDALASIPTDTCPKALRAVLERWKQGTAGNAELIDASYHAQLDLLQEYRWLPLPTPPEAVRYRRANPEVRMSGKDTEDYQRRYAAFFAQEQQILTKNHSHLLTLQELLGWAKGQGLPASRLQAIEAQIAQHRDVTVDDPEPF